MALSLANLARAQWTVGYEADGDLLVIIPATRETGLLANRLFFRLMNLPESVNVNVIFYEADFKAFRENELGYKEDDYKYGSRAYALAKRMASSKIHTQALVESNERNLHSLLREWRGVDNVLFYGLSSSNYKTHFFSIFEELMRWEDTNVLGLYVNGNERRGLTCHLVNSREDAIGVVNRPFDDSLQTQLTISTVMFNVLNKWVSGTSLGSNKLEVDLATGEINPVS